MPDITIIETEWFRRWVRKGDLRRSMNALSETLRAEPRAGVVVPGTGGLRKMRMAKAGKGKRGGYRVIYALVVDSRYLVFLFGYDKSKHSDLSGDEKSALVAKAALLAAALEAGTTDRTPDRTEEAL